MDKRRFLYYNISHIRFPIRQRSKSTRRTKTWRKNEQIS